jgi:hypothetical protein
MKASPSHWAGERDKAPPHALATYQVTTAVPGPRTVYRASFDFGFELASPESSVVVDSAAARFSGTFQPLDVTVPPAAISSGSPPVVTLDGPREVRRVAFTSAKSYNGSHVKLFRLDQQQLAPKETVSAVVGGGNAASGFGGFTDVRFAIGVEDSSPQRSEIAAITVRGAATGVRLGIADPDDPASLAFFWPTPDQTGTQADAGAAFGQALQAYLAGKAGDLSPTARLVMQGDQPCSFALTAFDTGTTFAVDGFAFPALVTSDLTDAPGLASRIHAAADPLSAHLRGAIGSAALLDGLNAIIAGASLYDAQRFAGVTLGPETQAALTAGGDPAWLNRLLLQDAYPDAVAAPSAKRVLRFGADRVGEATVAVRLPAGATVSKATLATQEELRADRSGTAWPDGGSDSRVGVHVGADGTTAVAVTVDEALSATGVALPLVAVLAGTQVSIELQEDWHGAPSGKQLAAATASVGQLGAAEEATVFFDPVVLASGPVWIVLRAAKGDAVWLAATDETKELRVVRAPDGEAATETVLPGLAPLCELFTRSGDAAGGSGTVLAVGATQVPAVQDGDRSTYDIAAALQAHGGAGSIPLTFTSPVAGTITVYPPHVEYEL